MPRKSISSARSGAKAVDALAFLKAQHREIAALFREYAQKKARMSKAQKRKLAREICDGLSTHAVLEAEIFYPALVGAVAGADDLLAESKVDHRMLNYLIADIAEGTSGAVRDAEIAVLAKCVSQHVAEEESELFAKVRKASFVKSGIDLKAIGAAMQRRKKELGAPARRAKDDGVILGGAFAG